MGRSLLGPVVIVAALAFVAFVRLFVYRDLGGTLVFGWATSDVLPFRLTALGSAALAGAALGTSGLLLQVLLRNPLASPYILGLSSGAALGVMVSLYIASVAGATFSTGAHAIPAGLGALGALAIVYALGQRRGWVDPLTLLLVGVVVSAIAGALILTLQHLVPHGLKGDLLTWMGGHIPESLGTTSFVAVAIVILAAVIGSFGLGRALDVAVLGDDEAHSVGLDLGPLRLVLFVVAGMLAAVSVALVGPIGFVGLIAPHAARLLLGARHRPLVLGSALLGAALLVGADALSQILPVRGGRMPAGVFTALVGGPAFIWLLRRGGSS